MADEETTGNEKTKITKHRSPNYPYIGLEESINRLRQVNDIGRGHFVAVGTARTAWGYQRNVGDRTTAALKAYGLIDVRGSGEKREIKPTEAGVKILEGHSQRDQLVKEAALSPEIHKEVWEKYGGNFPADVVIREYLRWDKKFNPENIDKFIDQFRATITFANLSASDKIVSSGEGDQKPPSHSGGQNPVQTQQQTTGQGIVPPPPKTNFPLTAWDELLTRNTEDVLSFNLSRTGRAQVHFNGQVTQEALRKLIALLDLSVDTYPTQAELLKPKVRKAMWKNKDHDQPVTVVEFVGERDGVRYYAIEGSDTALPDNELEFED